MNQRKRKAALYRRAKANAGRLAWVMPAKIGIFVAGLSDVISAARKMAAAMSAMQMGVSLTGAHKIISEEARNNFHASN